MVLILPQMTCLRPMHGDTRKKNSHTPLSILFAGRFHRLSGSNDRFGRYQQPGASGQAH